MSGFQNQVVENRIYSNTGVGLFITDSAINSLNRIYDNAIGVQTQFGFSGALTNNLIYRNMQFGVVMEGAGYYGASPRIINNTIVQTQGDAIKIRDGRTGRAILRITFFMRQADTSTTSMQTAKEASRRTTTSCTRREPRKSLVGKNATSSTEPIGFMKSELTNTVRLAIRCWWT